MLSHSRTGVSRFLTQKETGEPGESPQARLRSTETNKYRRGGRRE